MRHRRRDACSGRARSAGRRVRLATGAWHPSPVHVVRFPRCRCRPCARRPSRSRQKARADCASGRPGRRAAGRGSRGRVCVPAIRPVVGWRWTSRPHAARPRSCGLCLLPFMGPPHADARLRSPEGACAENCSKPHASARASAIDSLEAGYTGRCLQFVRDRATSARHGAGCDAPAARWCRRAFVPLLQGAGGSRCLLHNPRTSIHILHIGRRRRWCRPRHPAWATEKRNGPEPEPA